MCAYCIPRGNINKEEFNMSNERKMSVQTLVMSAVLTAIVAVLQFMGSFVKLGPFSISLVLIPIVIGTATCGWKIGSWLGLVFGVMVFITHDADAFLAVNIPGTIITVLAKGVLCGLVSGLAFKAAQRIFKGNLLVSTAIAAVICPVINTGIFLTGCLLFFMDTITEWAQAAGLGANVGQFMIFGLVGGNFICELVINIILCPIVVRILKASERM